MATWEGFEKAAPDLAASGIRMFEQSGVAYLMTMRKGGGPLVSPMVPIIAHGRLFVVIPQAAPDDDLDLLRNARYALHAMPGKNDEEFMVNGRATIVEDTAARESASETAGFTIDDQDQLFELHIAKCVWAIWEDVEHLGARRPIRKDWEASSPKS